MSTPVVLFKMPRLLQDIMQELIAGHPSFRLVEPTADESTLVDMVDAGEVEFVVVGAQTAALGRFESELLFRRPSLRVVQVAPDGRTAAMWQLRPDRTLLSEVSSEGLIAAMLAAAGRPAAVGESWNG